MNEMTLEEQIAATLVWALPDNATITVKQIKELAPVVTRIVERYGMKKGEANSYEQVENYIKKQYPKTYASAAKACWADGCQSSAGALIATIEKLAMDENLDKNLEE